jgi:hypothetical protein
LLASILFKDVWRLIIWWELLSTTAIVSFLNSHVEVVKQPAADGRVTITGEKKAT